MQGIGELNQCHLQPLHIQQAPRSGHHLSQQNQMAYCILCAQVQFL